MGALLSVSSVILSAVFIFFEEDFHAASLVSCSMSAFLAVSRAVMMRRPFLLTW